jgi:predicted DNA-binding transcriptional regulator AlpA
MYTETGSKLFTSAQAAGQIGISRPSLITFLNRHDYLRPLRKMGQDFAWTEGEITAVAQAKASAKPGRPAK